MAELGEVRGITVRGTGRVPVTPDQATITLGVEGRAKAAGGAQAAASTAMSAVIAALDELAIAPRDRATTGVTLDASYAYQPDGRPAKLTGYQARQTLEVRVRELARLGAILDGAIAAGATIAGGVSVSVADPSSASDQARSLAVADAMRHAQALARAAGVGVGPALQISELPRAWPAPLPRAMAMSAMTAESAPTPFEAGSTMIMIELEVTFAIA
jgi:hypothetical protein